MPNGGSICCNHCANVDVGVLRCSIFGTPVEPTLLCRMFRLERQTNDEALEQWELLRRLEPGAIYRIDNSYPPSNDDPRLAYRVVPVGPGETLP